MLHARGIAAIPTTTGTMASTLPETPWFQGAWLGQGCRLGGASACQLQAFQWVHLTKRCLQCNRLVLSVTSTKTPPFYFVAERLLQYAAILACTSELTPLSQVRSMERGRSSWQQQHRRQRQQLWNGIRCACASCLSSGIWRCPLSGTESNSCAASSVRLWMGRCCFRRRPDGTAVLPQSASYWQQQRQPRVKQRRSLRLQNIFEAVDGSIRHQGSNLAWGCTLSVSALWSQDGVVAGAMQFPLI